MTTLSSRAETSCENQQVKGPEKTSLSMDNTSRLIHSSTMARADSHPPSTVLIVDDDEEIRHALRLLCESEDMDVVGEASNGVEAVPIALHKQPDFVILDYKLPRLDGEGAAEILRAVIPETKIVAFSAMLDQQPHWADAYLNKDRIAELMPLLRTFIR